MSLVLNPGGNLNQVGSPIKAATQGNYLDFSTGWAQQYLPDLMEKEAEVFGNRSISGFLSQVGAEEAMAADQVVWSEQGRLHLSYDCQHVSEGLFKVLGTVDNTTAGTANAIRIGDTIIVSDAASTVKAYVTGTFNEGTATLTAGQFTAVPYAVANFITAGGLATAASGVKVFVYGSEYKKGTEGRGYGIDPQFKSYTNKPIILKDMFEVSGSDASQIGWVEVSGEDGQAGYLWYLKAEGDTKTRFADYCEMSMIEAVKNYDISTNTTVPEGTEGLFAAIEDRGNIAALFQAGSIATSDFDGILAEFDKQGAIEENMMFLDRSSNIQVDDWMATLNGMYQNGTSYGVFNNEEDMALNLGFTGFRRGSYDFYKSDWKYLNDKATRGGVVDTAPGNSTNGLGDVFGVCIPAGVSSVYDQSLGKNIKRPFLHVRYRASQTESRKMKSWVTGSVGAATSSLDAMNVHYLSERCLVVQGANNFMLFKG